MFYSVKAKERILKLRSSAEVPITSSSPVEEACNSMEHTPEHHFYCLAWFSNQDGFGLPYLMCQDTETMSLNGSYVDAVNQKGYHLGRIYCDLRHDPPLLHCMSPGHERWSCSHEVYSALCRIWRKKLQRKLWWSGGHHLAQEPMSLRLKLIYSLGCRYLPHLYQTTHTVEWKVWAQYCDAVILAVPCCKAHPHFLALSCYHHIPFCTSTCTGWWQDGYGNRICCLWWCALKMSYESYIFHQKQKRQRAEITEDTSGVWKEHGSNQI